MGRLFAQTTGKTLDEVLAGLNAPFREPRFKTFKESLAGRGLNLESFLGQQSRSSAGIDFRTREFKFSPLRPTIDVEREDFDKGLQQFITGQRELRNRRRRRLDELQKAFSDDPSLLEELKVGALLTNLVPISGTDIRRLEFSEKGQRLKALGLVPTTERATGGTFAGVIDPFTGLQISKEFFRDPRSRKSVSFGQALGKLGRRFLVGGTSFALGGPLASFAALAATAPTSGSPTTFKSTLSDLVTGVAAGVTPAGISLGQQALGTLKESRLINERNRQIEEFRARARRPTARPERRRAPSGGQIRPLGVAAGTTAALAAGGSKMGFFDDLGKIAIGAGSGALSGGGIAGGLAGGLSGLLNRGPLTFESGARGALMGVGAGQLGRSGFDALKRFRTPGIVQDGGFIGPRERPGFFSRLGRGAAGLGRGALDILGRGRDALGGLFGRRRGTADRPEIIDPASGIPTGTRDVGGRRGGFGRDLSLLTGLGLGAAGLAQGSQEAQLESVFANATPETRALIAERIAAERSRRLEAEEQFLGRRGEARGRIESLLGEGSDEALRRSIERRKEDLNRQGLLSGPSGALDFAVAQEAGDIRRENLPALLQFERETEGGLGALRAAGLESEIGLGQAGLEREFGISDRRTSARLIENLREAERARSRRRSLLEAGGRFAEIGFGGDGGKEGTGGQISGLIEQILNRG